MNSPATAALAALGWTEAAPGPASPTLTPDDEAALLARSATIHYARASLRVQRTPIPGDKICLIVYWFYQDTFQTIMLC